MDECIRRDLDKAQEVHDLAIMVMAQNYKIAKKESLK